MTGLPVKMTCAMREIVPELSDKIENLFPLELQKLYYMLNAEVRNGKTDI